ncbi:uncharacterized protein LOC133314875 [Gastrolobium bilobum]|uniref:uncharacterized protein LOC133314875 n=1 Tax=Gastrolobium bilobum TaxID=150636 RepID=UPI002AB31398|nr:uncharacterized protein LOC133314875 [Gastrolobium bilobum]
MDRGANTNPYDEQRLRNEVIYLHSLWRQGPPLPSPNPIHLPIQTPNNTIPIPYSYPEPYIPQQPLRSHFHGYQQRTTNPPFAPAHTRSLPPITSTAFKRKNKNKKKQKRKTRDPTNNSVGQPDPDRSPSLEWPCPVLPNPPTTGWATPKPRSDPPPSVSPEEKERLVAVQAQRKACKAFRDVFCSDDYDYDDEDDDVVVDDDDDNDYDGLDEFEEFFMGIFMEDDELRRYYQRCFENGEFYCLVCGAIGKKKSEKSYKDCVGLVQHSMSISRTVKKLAHRAFGHAVCKVLGWDIDRLPTIVMKGNPLGYPEAEGEPKEKVDGDGKDGTHKSGDKVVSLGHSDEPIEEHARGVDQSECSSKEADVKNNAENLDEKMLDIGLKNGGGAIDEVEPEKPTDSHSDD